jgi:MtN3 and saliva related transmembrane protein|tara:strand:+ start:36 stop:278 length:243 start_codon:yes stop_codon:yes gene_type:complete
MIGLFAGFLGVIAWIPQIKEVWMRKSHEGISLPTFWLIASALVLWLLYGILIQSYSIVLANIAALICILLVIIGVIKLRN